MRFLHCKVKARLGDRIRVETSKPTRVLIMTDREFKKYKNNNTFTYYGGFKDAPYEFAVPKSDAWEVVIEKGSYYHPEDITASVSKVTGGTSTLPPADNGKKKKKKKKDKEAEVELEAAAIDNVDGGDVDTEEASKD